jgi:hypothetical protein
LTQADWDDYLAAIAFAYRIATVNSIGFSPFFMVFGRQPTLPTDVLYGSETEIETDLEKYAVRHTKILRETYAKAIEIQKVTDAKKKAYFDQKKVAVEFAVGDKILIPSKVQVSGLSKKLQQKNLGPFSVVEKTSEVNYKVEPVGGGNAKIVHVQRMIPFKQNSDLDVFVQDSQSEDEKHDSVTPDGKIEQSGNGFFKSKESIPSPELNSKPEILTKRIRPSGTWEFLVKEGLIQEWKPRDEIDQQLVKIFESKARADRLNRRLDR